MADKQARRLTISEGQAGFIPVWLCLCLAVTLAWLHYYPYFESIVPTTTLIACAACWAVILFCTIGWYLTKFASGEKSPRQLRKLLRRQIAELAKLIDVADKAVNTTEKDLAFQSGCLRPAAYDELQRLKIISVALKNRHNEVSSLLAKRGKGRLYKAAALIGEPLRSFESARHSIIDHTPFTPIPSEEWESTIRFAVDGLGLELQRASGIAASRFAS